MSAGVRLGHILYGTCYLPIERNGQDGPEPVSSSAPTVGDVSGSTREQVTALVTLLRAVLELARDEQLTFLAAAIAYYAFLSLVPLFIVSVTVATVLAGETLAEETLAIVGTSLTPEASALLASALQNSSGRGGVTAVGLLVLAWSGLRVFRALDIAFSRIYGATGAIPLLGQLRRAVLVAGAIALALGAAILVVTAVGTVTGPVFALLGPVGLLLVLPVVFFPLYYVFPATDVTVRETIPGAVFAASGWTMLSLGFGVYASYAGSFQLYGVLGGVLLLLVWFYFGGLVLLLGAAVNAVAADRSRDRQLQQGSLREAN